jgi:hypothetical protein
MPRRNVVRIDDETMPPSGATARQLPNGPDSARHVAADVERVRSVAAELAADGERPFSLAKLRALPGGALHPLRRLLLDKGVSLADGAAHLSWSVRRLGRVIAWERRPRDPECRAVASALGFDPDELFPRLVVERPHSEPDSDLFAVDDGTTPENDQ